MKELEQWLNTGKQWLNTGSKNEVLIKKILVGTILVAIAVTCLYQLGYAIGECLAYIGL